MNLKGKKAVITGISKGIGKACAEKLLESGAHVAGWGQTPPSFKHENLTFIQTDVRKEVSIEAAFKETMQAFDNEIHILINNAGLGFFGPFEEITPEQYHQMMQTNVDGVFYATRKVIPVMKALKTGHIINLSSIAGLESNAQVGIYSATKFAVNAITQSLYKELRDWGIKVTGIYPGSVKTAFFDNAQGIDAHDYMMKPGEVADTIMHALKTPDNYLLSQIVMRPLQPKGPPQESK